MYLNSGFAYAFHLLFFTAHIWTPWLRQHNRQHKVIGPTFLMGLNKQAIGQRHSFSFIRKCYLAVDGVNLKVDRVVLWGYRSTTVQQNMVKALVLNGLIFLGGLLILETFYNEPTHRFLGCSYAVRIGSTLGLQDGQ